MNGKYAAVLLWGCAVMTGCGTMNDERDFGEDVAFLREHVETIVLRAAAGGARVAVVPAYQGRVMTSSAGGDHGASYGWLNYEHIASGELVPHINVFGGEERFWLGPEGGQYAIFFAPGSEFDLVDWQTPAAIDSEPYDVVTKSTMQVVFRKRATFQNYSGARFEVSIDRTVRLLDEAAIARHLGVDPAGTRAVGYETVNRITNAGDRDWTKGTGLLSIWLLGMFKPGDRTTVVIPFKRGDDDALGPIVNDAYFGKVPAERLAVGDGVLYFSGDGGRRSKIGIGPRRAVPVCGSWDPGRGALTIVQYDPPVPPTTDYVNSMWEKQEAPYGGDVINSYNDGPPKPGAPPLGPFYELETSSPALALRRGASGQHVQRTFHLEGDRDALDRIARKLLVVGLTNIEHGLGER